MKGLFALAVAATLALAACGGTAVANTTTASNGHVTVTLTDTKITLDKASVPAGAVTFSVKNVGTTTHEVVVIKTGVAQDKLPADPEEAGKVSEDGSQGESGDLEKGESKDFTLTLAAGSYVLICNQPGHYAMGMHIAFTVK